LSGGPRIRLPATTEAWRGIVCDMSKNTSYIAHNGRQAPAPDQDALYAIAEARAGYFTVADAKRAGYSRSLVAHHVLSGMLERVDRGIYRLSRFPEAPQADLAVAWLRAGEASAISHESALGLYGLSDVMPHEVHVTLPRTASRRHGGLRLHTSPLGDGDTTLFEGVRVTTVERTIVDVARAGLAEELVLQAIGEALERGLTTSTRLAEAAAERGGRAKRLVQRALGGEHGEVR
jgi:predicted transcriptional regulator of viral defense system